MNDLYDVLGISRDAVSDQVRAAYRAKAKKAHPDAGGSREAFEEVSLAYEVLIDESRRKTYDQTGHIEGTAKESIDGGKRIIEGLINEIAERDDARFIDLIQLMSAHVTRALNEKFVRIEKLEASKGALIDLKERFRSKSHSETFIQDLIKAKIDTTTDAVAAERALLARLRAALGLLNQYEFVREVRERGPSGEIDVSAFGPKIDPLLDTTGMSAKS